MSDSLEYVHSLIASTRRSFPNLLPLTVCPPSSLSSAAHIHSSTMPTSSPHVHRRATFETWSLTSHVSATVCSFPHRWMTYMPALLCHPSVVMCNHQTRGECAPSSVTSPSQQPLDSSCPKFTLLYVCASDYGASASSCSLRPIALSNRSCLSSNVTHSSSSSSTPALCKRFD